jgi:hypothetical protein
VSIPAGTRRRRGDRARAKTHSANQAREERRLRGRGPAERRKRWPLPAEDAGQSRKRTRAGRAVTRSEFREHCREAFDAATPSLLEQRDAASRRFKVHESPIIGLDATPHEARFA